MLIFNQKMNYKTPNETPIKNTLDWEKYLFSGNKKKHWKKGRSAYEIADFLLNKGGEKTIGKVLESIVGESVTFDYGIPEMEVRFDGFGHGREHDVGIYGITESGKRLFVGVEAKVDETFNEKIGETYLKAKSKELSGMPTNVAKRIEGLLQRNFSTVKPEHFELRYQLLYSTIGTVEAKDENKALDLYFMFVIVFKTSLYDALKGIENYKDYIQFIDCLDAKSVMAGGEHIDIHEVKLDNNEKELYTIYMNIV